MRQFARGLDKVLTVEGCYSWEGWDVIRDAGAKSVLIANPELYADDGADVVRVPTPWCADRIARAAVLPHPVSTDRLTYRHRTSAATFYHPTAPAMLDRNGTESVLEALPHVKHECTFIIRGGESRSKSRVGNVTVDWRTAFTDDYWDAYPDEADVIVLPRRYGGLCLPVQESAALGMPALMTDLAPQSDWPHVMRVPAKRTMSYRMKGGRYDVHTCDPVQLAERIDLLIESPWLVSSLSQAAGAWATRRSWARLYPMWAGLCA
jgi:hypothetical protein